jgi:mRNA interferase MazF
MTNNTNKGDVVYITFPIAGQDKHEQSGQRPAVVMQNVKANDKTMPTVMVIPCTSKLSALRFNHALKIEPSTSNGLTSSSVLLVFQLRAIDKQRISHKIGNLEDEHMKSAEKAIKKILSL